MTNCPPVYRNLQCESFANKRKITSQMLRQMCKNDAYLYEQVMALWDETDPKSRKRFYPPYFMDASMSFGVEEYDFSGYYDDFFRYYTSVYRFNSLSTYHFKIDFNGKNDMMNNVGVGVEGVEKYTYINADTYLDLENANNEWGLEIVREDTTGNASGGATLRPIIQTGSYKETIHHDAVYEETGSSSKTYVKPVKEKLGKEKKDAHFLGAFKNWHCNNHWHNGFDRTKNYNIKAKWEKDPDSYDIPSVCHAQTFKAQSSGRLSKVNLNITGDKNAKSPCIVEIRPTKKGKPTKTVLARTEKKFTANGQKVTAFEFKNGMAEIKKGETYAIVVRSPLSTFAKSYKLGGWTTGCFSSEKKYYGEGSAYTSTDNGKTWIKNGKTKDSKSYGAHYYDWGINQKPIDFAFEVYVRPITQKAKKGYYKKTANGESKPQNTKVAEAYDDVYDYEFNYYKAGRYYLHLKPIQVNPIDKFSIHSTFDDDSTYSQYWVWEYFDYSARRWVEIDGHGDVNFNNNVTHYTVLMLRVRCDVTENTIESIEEVEAPTTNTNVITNLVKKNKIGQFGLTCLREVEIIVECREADKGYLRTQYYHPPKQDMLGASIWSEINVKAKASNNAELEIDVIHEKEVADHYKFYDLAVIEGVVSYDIDNYDEKVVDTFETLSELINEYSGGNTLYSDGSQIISYIVEDNANSRDFINFLQNQVTPVYIIPYFVYDNEGVLTASYSFFETLKLSHKPAYPLIGGDIGDDDIVIDVGEIHGFSEYGAYYYFPQPLKTFNGLHITYNTYREDMDVATIDGLTLNNSTYNLEETNTEEDIYIDEDGFEVEPNQAQEQIAETLTGVFLDNNAIWHSNELKVIGEGVFKKNGVIDTTIDYAITKDLKNIVFNGKSPLIQSIFPGCTIFDENSEGNGTDTTLFTEVGGETVDNPQLKVDLMQKAYKEFVDFDVDYDDGTLTFADPSELVGGDFKVTYNPLWIRGLSPADFPLALDLWKERYEVVANGIYKQKFNTDTGKWERSTFYAMTNINPLTNRRSTSSFYRFKTSVPPLDAIRKLVVNEDGDDGGDSLTEEAQFFVDYLSNDVTLLLTASVNVGDIITIHYTPNLTDSGLALGFRMKRPRYRTNLVVDSNIISDEESVDDVDIDDSNVLYEGEDGFLNGTVSDNDNVYIGMISYTYRT